MLYTVAKLTALLSGVAMAADHCVPHSDETEHMEDEDAHGPTLCWDVIHEILPFCDVSEWPSLKLTNRHICQVIRERAFAETKTRFGDRFIGDYANYMREFEHGIVECGSIDQVIESVLFSRSNQMCFTPRFCGKLILYRRMVNRWPTKSRPILRLQSYYEIPLESINKHVQLLGDRGSFSNDNLIVKFREDPALMNIRTGKVTHFPPCRRATFFDDRTIVLFDYEHFQFYDLFEGEGDLFKFEGLYFNPYLRWYVIQGESGVRIINLAGESSDITFVTLDNDDNGWVERSIDYEQSAESQSGFKQYLSPDGSVLIAIEIFKDKCSLVNIVDTRTKTIKHTVILPYDYFDDAKVSRNGVYFHIRYRIGVLMDLKTGRWARLTEPGKVSVFFWMGDSRFWLEYQDESGYTCTHIRSLEDPFTDLIQFQGGSQPLSADLICMENGKVLKLTEMDECEENPSSLD